MLVVETATAGSGAKFSLTSGINRSKHVVTDRNGMHTSRHQMPARNSLSNGLICSDCETGVETNCLRDKITNEED